MIDPAAVSDVLAILVPSIEEHREHSKHPFVLGLSGLQGSGKSTWAAALCKHLNEGHGYNTRALSIDDLYHDHRELIAIREKYPENKILRTRGQPGTHDEALAKEFFGNLFEDGSGSAQSDRAVRWPAYDKSLHHGQGGRVPQKQWENVSLNPPLDILIFEGWCLGFQPLNQRPVTDKWQKAKTTQDKSERSTTTLADHRLEDLLQINQALERYCDTFMGPWRFDSLLHLSTDDLSNVYEWRLDQERALRKTRPGMSDGEVVQFVKGYMPSYELFLERLQTEFIFTNVSTRCPNRKHIQVTLDSARKIVLIKEL